MRNLAFKMIFLLTVFPVHAGIEVPKETFSLLEEIQRFLPVPRKPGLIADQVSQLMADHGIASEEDMEILEGLGLIYRFSPTVKLAEKVQNFINFYEGADEQGKQDIREAFLVSMPLVAEKMKYKPFNIMINKTAIFPQIIYLGDLDLLNYVLENNIFSDRTVKKYSGKSMLEWAFQWSRFEIIEWLFTNYSQTKEQDLAKIFRTELERDNLEGMNWLVEHGFNITAEHIKQAVLSQKLSTAEWLFRQNPQAFDELDSVKLFNTMLNDNHLDGMNWFVEHGLNVTAEHIKQAVLSQKFETAEWLFRQNPQAFDELDSAKLFNIMLERDHLDGMNWLAEHGFNIAAEHIKQAALSQKLKAAEWLIEQNPQAFDELDSEGLVNAMLDGDHLAGMNWLAEHGLNVTAEHIKQAVLNQKFEIAEWLFRKKLQAFDELNSEELFLAMLERNNLEGVKWLAEHGLNITAEHIKQAVLNQKFEIAEWHIEQNDQVDLTKLLEMALSRNDLQTADWLFERGAIPLEKQFDQAMENNFPETAEWILEKLDLYENRHREIVAEEEGTSQVGELAEAISNRDFQKVKLLSKTVDINEEYQGYTALMRAISIQDQKQIGFFMRHKKIQIDKQTSEGMTAFMLAVAIGDFKTVEELGDRGVDPGKLNSRNQTALDIAEAIENPQIKQKMIQKIRRNLCKKAVSD